MTIRDRMIFISGNGLQRGEEGRGIAFFSSEEPINISHKGLISLVLGILALDLGLRGGSCCGSRVGWLRHPGNHRLGKRERKKF